MLIIFLKNWKVGFRLAWILIWFGTLQRIFPFALIILIPFRKHLRLSLWKSFFLVLGVSIGTVLPTVYFFHDAVANDGNYKLYYSLLWFLPVVFVLVFLFRCYFFKTILIAFIVKGYVDDIYFISLMIAKSYYLVENYLLAFFIVGSLVCVTTMIPIYYFIIRPLKLIFDLEDTMRFWHYLWMIPASFYILFRVEIYPQFVFHDHVITSANNVFLLSFVWFIGTFLSYFITLQMILEFSRNVTLKEQLHTQEMQLAVQKNHYESIRKDMEHMERFQHDFKHHIAVMKSYLNKQNYGGLEAYLKQCMEGSEFANNKDAVLLCENFAVDAIVRHYWNIANEAGITVSATIHLEKILPISENDICIVVGNLLQNSVEACKRQKAGEKFIELKIEQVGTKIIALTIKNSYEGNIVRDGEHFMSSKRDERGIGIASICSIVERYNGYTKFEYDGHIFHAYALLNCVLS